MSEITQKPSMDIETTFECPRCHKVLPVANQLTHDVACARMHRDDQRAPVTQPTVRQSSSGGNAQQRTQLMPRREDRRVGEIAENKLITCPNCEKSVREQDMDSHIDNECLKSEMIPCEFCEDAIPMSNYSQHVESCPRRARRDRSPIRERMATEPSQQQQQQQQQGRGGRDRSPQRGSNQGGGIGGFFRNIGSAANQLLGLNPESQQQQQRQREQRELELAERRREEERQREFLEHMFGQPQAPRNLPQSNQNTMIQYSGGPAGGQTVIRTVESAPGGFIVRSQVIPANNNQMFQQSQAMEVNPLGLLLGMVGGNIAGLIPIGNGEFEMGPQAEEQGLDKETINSLALIKYNKEKNKNLSEDLKKCPICLDEFEDGQEVRFLWCTHRFHKGCVDQWLEKHTTCPICKKDFSEAEHGYSP